MSVWETKTLGEVAYLAGRIGWKGLTAKEYTDKGPLLVSVHALNYGDYVDFRDVFHISQERYDESPEIMLQTGDVLICKDGAGIGKVGIIGDLPAPATINSSLLLIRPLDRIEPKFLYFALCSPIFQTIVNERIDGATTPHLYQREIRQFPIRLPPLSEQRRIVTILDEVSAGLATMRANAEAKLIAVDALKQSILARACSGELTSARAAAPDAHSLSASGGSSTKAAFIIARAFARHQRDQRDWSFGHVKAQKTLHMVEAVAEYELGRTPRKDAAGPNDMPHMTAAERWAADNRYFRFPKIGESYRLEPLEGFDALLRQADSIDPATLKAIDRVIDVFIPMDAREAELFATVYAAWNNLLIDGKPPTDNAIIREAREDWHHKKTEIKLAEFVKALAAVRRSGIIPTGKGKRVGDPPQARFL
jgi:type I restriction enzyme S subunit